MYSHSTAILLVFLSHNVLTTIKHVHIGLVVCRMGSKLFTQGRILPFVDSIESDLKEVREMCMQGKEIGQAWSYSCLVANYGDIMALPSESPYCLVYPTIYDDHAKDKTHFNTTGCPSEMHIKACVCCSLLHLMDTDPANRQKFKGSCLLVPCGMQYSLSYNG